MKIFEIIYNYDEKQWICADTNIEALQHVIGIEETDLDFMKEIKELPEDKWDEWHVTNTEYDESDKDDWETMTFRSFLNQAKDTHIISSTFYDF